MKFFFLKTALALLLCSFGTEAVFIFHNSTTLIVTTSDMEDTEKGKAFEEEKKCHDIYAALYKQANLSYIGSFDISLFISHYPLLPEIPPDSI